MPSIAYILISGIQIILFLDRYNQLQSQYFFSETNLLQDDTVPLIYELQLYILITKCKIQIMIIYILVNHHALRYARHLSRTGDKEGKGWEGSAVVADL